MIFYNILVFRSSWVHVEWLETRTIFVLPFLGLMDGRDDMTVRLVDFYVCV